jgi:arylsulfatase
MAGMAPFFGVGPPPVDRTRFTYYPGTDNIGSGMIPHLYNRSFTIAADLDIPAQGAEGVIVAEGDVMGGFSLYVQNGKLHYTYSFLGIKVETLTSSEDLPAGKVQARYEFIADQPGKPATGGRGRLFINSKLVGENRVEQTVPQRFTAYAGMDIGKDNGEAVSPMYQGKSPFAFTGRIEKVVFDLSQQ